MEFTNEIFFNKPLTAGSTVIITYSGKLYREHSKDVTIVYGYGDNWEYTDSSPMIETENGFEVTLTLKDYNTFNFCFSNSFNIWDNNFGFNYISPIAPKKDKENDRESIENTTEEVSSNSDQEIIEENDEQNEENNQETQEKAKDDIEAAFSTLLDSILDDAKINEEPINASDLSGFGLQSVDNIKEEDMINCNEIFDQLFDELTVENKDVTQVEAINEEKVTSNDKDIEELDKLMNDLLFSLSEDYKPELEESATPIQKVEVEELETSDLPAVIEQDDWLDKFLDASYNFTKKFTDACKKIGTLIKLKAQELGIINKK